MLALDGMRDRVSGDESMIAEKRGRKEGADLKEGLSVNTQRSEGKTSDLELIVTIQSRDFDVNLRGLFARSQGSPTSPHIHRRVP